MRKKNKLFSLEALQAAKRMAYLSDDIHIPRGIRNKIKIYINDEGSVVIKWIGKKKK